MLKVTPHKDASWPEAVENVQMFPDTYIMCVYVYIMCTLCAVVLLVFVQQKYFLLLLLQI